MQITGSTVSAAQALTLTAGNDLLLDAAESSDQRHFRKTTTQTQGLGRKAVANTLDTFSVRQTGATLSAGHIDLSAGNDLTLIATAVAATGDIRFTAGAEIAYLAATQLDEFHATRKTSDNLLGFANLSGLIDNGWQQAKAKRETTSTTRTGAVTVIQTPDAVLSQSAGDTTLAGTTIRAGRFTATAGLGANGEGGQANAQIHLLGIKESETFSQTKESGSFMWQSAKGEGHRTETLRLPDIQAYGASTAAPAIGPQEPVGDVPETERASELASLSPTLTAPGGITVGATDLPTTQAEANRATPGHAGNGTPPPTVKLDLKTQAETLAQQPGLAWLGELAQRDDVDWQQIALIHDQWDYKQSGLTQEGAAVIAIVVAILTWGSASSAGAAVAEGAGMTTAAGTAGASTVAASTAGTVLTTTGAAVATATAAGITTLATQASVSLINNKGDIGQTLKDLGSSDSVKQLLTSMLTAGALNAVGGTDWMKQFNGTTITDRLVTQMVNSAVSATVQTAVMGGSYEDTLSTMLLTGGVNATAGWAAGEIGAWYADANTDIAGKYLAHKVAHALLGCAGAAAKGDDCASGAIGGAVGEAFAEMMGHATEGPLTDAQRKQILDLSKLVAVATAAVTGHDVNAAADAAVIAVANNYLLHKEILDYTKAERACRGGNEDQCTVVKIYEAKSAERDHALAAACADSSSSACAIEQQNVRNAQAEILRAGVTDFDYARVAAETKLQADSTLSSSDRLLGAAKGWTAATVDGVISLGKGLVTLAEAAFGDSQAQAKAWQTWYDLQTLADPEVLVQVLTNASASQREALAKAYETGNAAEVGRLGGELLSMLPMGGGVGSLRNAGKVLDEASMLSKAASAATAAERIAANQAKGMKFEEAVLAYMIETKNKQAFTTQIGEKTITVIPDSVLPSGAILEIKDVAYLTNSNQFRAYASATATAKSGEVLSGPIELVVSPGTRISAPLKSLIEGSGSGNGKILVFDPVTRQVTKWAPPST